MGFRMRKSINIAPGVRLNVSRSGVGYSAGGKGVRVTKHANGRVSRTLSIPGTGLSHHTTISPGRSPATSGGHRQKPSATAAAVTRPPSLTATPGLLAPAWEKDLFAVLSSTRPEDYGAVARKHGRTAAHARTLSAALEGLLHFDRGHGDPNADARARSLLGWAVAQDATDPMMRFVGKYLVDRTWPVEIVPGVTAQLRLQDDVLLLAAAELHQAAGDLDAAIWTVEQAHPSAHAALSLVELYSAAGRHRDVIDMTNGVTNSDDATSLLLALRGRAFAQLGFNDAAREGFAAALRVRSRSAPVRHRALLERAQVDLAQNRKAAARKNFERILAEDPTYPGLADMLASLS